MDPTPGCREAKSQGSQDAGNSSCDDFPYPRVLFLNWRDLGHPEGGGAEQFAEQVATGLADRLGPVTLLSASYPGAPPRRVTGRLTSLHRGGRFTVYAQGLLEIVRHARRYDVIVDVQNGVPFWAPVVTRRPVIRVVHHVHREQWSTVFGPRLARLGWWLESRVATAVYRRCTTVTVSHETARELIALGTPPEQIRVIYSGNVRPTAMPDLGRLRRTEAPSIVVLGRLVPHKRVELAIDAVGRLRREGVPVTATIIGHGYWEGALRARAQECGVDEAVSFLGFVPEAVKHEVLARSWVHVLPSVKEGWGLAVIEAGMHGTPSIAFRAAGGPAESILDGTSGLLVDDEAAFGLALHSLLTDHEERERLGTAARAYASTFSWATTTEGMDKCVRDVLTTPDQRAS